MSNQPTEPSTAEDLLGAPGSRSRRSRSPNGRTLSAFHTALTELAARRNVHHSDWKPTISTSKLLQRQIALDLCGWSLKQDDLSKAIKRYETSLPNLITVFDTWVQVGERRKVLQGCMLANLHETILQSVGCAHAKRRYASSSRYAGI